MEMPSLLGASSMHTHEAATREVSLQDTDSAKRDARHGYDAATHAMSHGIDTIVNTAGQLHEKVTRSVEWSGHAPTSSRPVALTAE
jgi:short-subunit dehydrogenase